MFLYSVLILRCSCIVFKRAVLEVDVPLSVSVSHCPNSVQVADFGLSKCKRGTSRRSLGQEEGDGYGGTLEYMPPEAFTDMNYKPSTGTDVYRSVVLQLAWVLKGQHGFSHVLDALQLHKHRSSTVPVPFLETTEEEQW